MIRNLHRMVVARSPGDMRADARWRLVSSEPHRLMFFCGALQAVVAFAWWAADIAARYVGTHAAFAWSVPPMWAHAWLLLYGLFPFFIFGFLMTAGPNWLGAPKPARAVFIPVALGMAGGVALFYVGLAAGRGLTAAGLLLHLAGWVYGIGALMRMAARHWNPNARYAIVLFTFLALGAAGSGLFMVSVASGSYAYAGYALHGAVWFFLLPIFLGVSTRMVPFFSSRVLGPGVDYKPAWARPVLLVGALLHGVLELSGNAAWLWIVDLPLAVVIGHLAWRWGLGRSAGVRLLAVLHISLTVLAAALAFYGISSVLVAIGAAPRIGLAPLHLIALGYFGAMTLGMVSRVSLGHSGRALEMDAWTWRCYLGVLAAALARVAAEFAPGSAAGGALMAAAALAAFAAFAAWAWRYVPMYLAPRVDAR